MYKRAHHTLDIISVAISVASVNYVDTFTTPYDLAQLSILTYGYPNPTHSIIKDQPYRIRVKIL